MSERASALVLALVLGLASGPAAAQEEASILTLPFKARAMRGPGSEVAVAVATSGLAPGVKPASAVAAGEEPDHSPLAVVWGEDGAAALTLGPDGGVRATALGPDAVEALVAAETPRGALSGIRRTASGGLSAYLSGSTRALAADGPPNAATLTVRERQPMAVSNDPKPVATTTTAVSPPAGAVFAPRHPRALRLDGEGAFLAVIRRETGSSLALIGRTKTAGAPGASPWSVLAESPPQAGLAQSVAAIADMAGAGRPQVAALAGGVLRVWTIEGNAFALAAELPGFSGPEDDADLAAAADLDGDGRAELILPASGSPALAVLAASGAAKGAAKGAANGTTKGDLKAGLAERARIPLPAPAGFGLSVLGKGTSARILVGLADGRVAVAPVPGKAP